MMFGETVVRAIRRGLTFGAYTVERKLGEGGMAEVWECRHRGLGSAVAVKFLRERDAQSETGRLRFFAEARALASIDSPYVVRVLDCGETEDGLHYIVMERLVGLTLRELTGRQGGLSETSALWLIADACHGVAAAHRAGLAHRDIKPGNLFVTGLDEVSPTCRVLDFGIAKGLGEAPTKDGVLVGTVSYMAPEQARSEPSTVATDVYALGVVLFEAITGAPFVEGSTEEAQLLRILRGEHNETALAKLSQPVAEIVRRATAFRASARFESVEALASELELAALAISGRERFDTGAVTNRVTLVKKSKSFGLLVTALGWLTAAGVGFGAGRHSTREEIERADGVSLAQPAAECASAPPAPPPAVSSEPAAPTAPTLELGAGPQLDEVRDEKASADRQRPAALARLPVAPTPKAVAAQPPAQQQNTGNVETNNESRVEGNFIIRNPYRSVPGAPQELP